jgi:arylsulfatase A-like enzyme
MTGQTPTRTQRTLRWAFPLALALWLLGAAISSTPAVTGPVPLAVLGATYLLLAFALDGCARFLVSFGRAWGLGGALLVGLVVAAERRLDAEVLSAPLHFALLATAVAVAWFAATLWTTNAPATPRRPWARLLALLGSALLLVGLVVAAWASGGALRWHLANHHRLFGTPLYYLLARPIAAERTLLWSAERRLVEAWEKADQVVPRPPSLAAGAPNLVFLLIDTLRADGLASFGGRADTMPGMDAIAARSFVLSNVLSNASWTRASVASILTGLLPEEHGAVRFHDRLPSGWRTLPELLQEGGWQTAAFVSNWVQVGRSTGFEQGFERFEELHSAQEVHQLVEDAGGPMREMYARADEVQASALAWSRGEERAQARARGAAAFLYLHYLDPHAPYLEGPEPGASSDPRERKHGAYRQQLRYLDRHLAPFFEEIAAALGGRTIVILTSDHGEEFWEHGKWGHGHNLYRELVHVPTLVWSSDGSGVGTSDAALESRDLFALVLALAGSQSVDLAAWAREHARSRRYASQYLDLAGDARPDKKYTCMRAVEEGGQVLIWSAYADTLEFYDRRDDPREQRNLVDEEPERARAFERQLERCVGFWAEAVKVQRTAGDLAFLRALGYAGGTQEETEAAPPGAGSPSKAETP